jgi:hypothetical protein
VSFRRAEPERALQSPCVNICVLDPDHKHCIGCGRSLSEIAQWTRLGEAARAELMIELPRRLARLSGTPAPPPGPRRRD